MTLTGFYLQIIEALRGSLKDNHPPKRIIKKFRDFIFVNDVQDNALPVVIFLLVSLSLNTSGTNYSCWIKENSPLNILLNPMLESLSDADSTIDTASFIKAIKKILSATTANKSTHLKPFKGVFNLSEPISILLYCCQQLIAQRIKNSVCKFTFDLTFSYIVSGLSTRYYQTQQEEMLKMVKILAKFDFSIFIVYSAY